MKMQYLFYIGVVLFIVVVISIVIDYNYIEVSEYEIESSKISSSFEGYKILQLSDFHSYQFFKGNEYILEHIDKVNPDIVVVTGDLIDCSDKNFDTAIDLMKIISEKYDLYYILGNHELGLKTKSLNDLLSSLKDVGVHFLDNQKVELIKDNQKINLYGLYYDLEYYRNSRNLDGKDINTDIIEKRIGVPNENEFNVLLSHNSLHFDIISQMNFDLVLSGHVHGGIIRFPVLGGLISPEVTFFPKYDGGKYENNNSTMIVNRGIGLGTIPFRVFNPFEISVITLKSL